MVKGAAAIAAIGTAAYLYSASAPKTKRKIKRSTSKAVHSMGSAITDVSNMMR